MVDIGEVVEGRYKILSPLGEGGMSTVFLAEHWLIKRRVAMKILHSEYASDADMIRRFMNEALAAGTLGHPNIVESTDMGFTRGDVPYIVYEYVEGVLLSHEIHRVAEIPVRRALKIAIQIASALEAAHGAGIVHRDLKTDNIFLTSFGDRPDHVKVLDFGISRFLHHADRTAIGGKVLGTPEFMAPEQALNPDGVDKRADIYALGIVLYEMLSKRVPFALTTLSPTVDELHALIHRIITEPPPPLEREDLPEGLESLIADKLLAKDPEDRFQSMKDAQAALERYVGMIRHSSQHAAVQPEDDDDESPAKPKRRSKEMEQLTDQTLSRQLLDPVVLAREVKQLGKRWTLDGTSLKLELFDRSMAKLSQVIAYASTVADEIDHQPMIAVRAPKLTLTIKAYDGKAIAVLDLVFAARIEQWLRDTGWSA
jgi:serine/threonine protein kinase